MKMSRIVLAVLLLTAAVAPLSAQEIAASVTPVTPEVDLSFADAGGQTAALRCVQYFCPVYPEYGCSCEWVLCEDGSEVCGVPRYPAVSASTETGCGSPVAQSSAL